jgi:Ca-activated chloride channel family protein
MSWFEAWSGVALLDPWFLALAPLVPLALWLRRRRGQPALRFAPASLLEPPLPRSARQRLLPWAAVLQLAGLLLVIVALTRPVRREPLPPRSEGIDILLCLDLSSSMSAEDLEPGRTRLDVAREAATRFLAGRPHDRIGLLGFARFPDLICPPTLDRRALTELLRETRLVEPNGPEDLTGIGTAVAKAAEVLRGSKARSKVVVLLTDGEENVATVDAPDEIGPPAAARICAAFGVRVHAVAAGGTAPDAPPLDTGPIERLAAETGGRFFAARDAGAVGAVYAAIDALEKTAFDAPRFSIEERFLPYLLLAVGLLVAARMLQATWLAVLP